MVVDGGGAKRPFYDPPRHYAPDELLISFRHPPDDVHACLRDITPALNDHLAPAGLRLALHEPALPAPEAGGGGTLSEFALSEEQMLHEQVSVPSVEVPAVSAVELPGWTFRAARDDGWQHTVVRYHIQPRAERRGADAVLEATAALVPGLSLLNDRLGGAATLHHAIPNWPMTGEPVSWPVGGPAGRPAPEEHAATTAVPAARWHITFGAKEVDALAPAAVQGGPQALVVVLDTSPSQEEVDAAARRYPHNGLLAEVASGGARPIAVDAVELGVARRPPPSEYRAVRGDHDEPYLMPDHGLFVAGIIRDIAPDCEIRLIRVLNDYGAGTVKHLLAALRYVDDLTRTESRPIVVNFSGVCRVPPDLDKLYGDAGLANPYRVEGDATATLIRATLPLVHILEDVAVGTRDHSTIFVAAAGNDAEDPAARPNPDPPALFDQTLAVAAVGARRQPAPYSNKAGDGHAAPHGIATFGGVSSSAAPDQPLDAVRGLFISSPVPVAPDSGLPSDNPTGWARWVGTSFSTPVISGLVARMLAQDPTLPLEPAVPRGDSVLGRLKQLAAGDEPALNCHTIAAAQEFV